MKHRTHENLEHVRTLNDLFSHSTEKYASRTVNSFIGKTPVLYGEFAEKVGCLQETLKSLGVAGGDKVAIYTHNSPVYSVVYFAVTTVGAVIVPLLPDFSPAEVENIINHSDSKVLFVSERLKNKTDDINVPNLKIRICLENMSIYENRDALTVCRSTGETEIQPDSTASIVYTSGTTGKSKGVVLTHHNLISQIKMTLKIEPVNETSVFLSILPLPHTYEGSLGFLLPFLAGASVYYLEKPPTPTLLIPAVQQVKPTHILSVPLIPEKIFRNSVLAKINSGFFTRNLYRTTVGRKLLHRIIGKKLYKTFGGRLKFFGVGGAKLDPVTERFLYEARFPYAIGYGLTETAPLLSAALSYNVKVESAGFKLEEVEMKINDPNEAEIGELWVKSPSLMKGYYKDEELTNSVITPDGWFKTGDLVKVNSSGRIYLKGRLKNIILTSNGENIYPEEIESVINNFKFVQESLVLEEKGKLVAMVKFNYEELGVQYSRIKEEVQSKLEENYRELEKKIEELKLELMTYVNSKVNRFSQISKIVALPVAVDFEKTSTMKIKRYMYL
ncbi:MAG: AMP-binding protein [Prevotellaceae bacterium]|jgi:long-chain acyl-CoA synthetase|nr:AMP-binding protein [Prevotellaceae bacterium]